jgi:type II secretory pathway component PulF
MLTYHYGAHLLDWILLGVLLVLTYTWFAYLLFGARIASAFVRCYNRPDTLRLRNRLSLKYPALRRYLQSRGVYCYGRQETARRLRQLQRGFIREN